MRSPPETLACFLHNELHGLDQWSANVSSKGLHRKYFRLVGHMVSVASTQLWHYGIKAATDRQFLGK